MDQKMIDDLTKQGFLSKHIDNQHHHPGNIIKEYRESLIDPMDPGRELVQEFRDILVEQKTLRSANRESSFCTQEFMSCCYCGRKQWVIIDHPSPNVQKTSIPPRIHPGSGWSQSGLTTMSRKARFCPEHQAQAGEFDRTARDALGRILEQSKARHETPQWAVNPMG